MSRRYTKNKVSLFFIATPIVVVAVSLVLAFDQALREFLKSHLGGLAAQADTITNVLKLVLLAILAYLVVRALNTLIFGVAFRFRRGFDAPTLIRNIFSIVAFTALFFLIFATIFPDINLGALFTTSAISA